MSNVKINKNSGNTTIKLLLMMTAADVVPGLPAADVVPCLPAADVVPGLPAADVNVEECDGLVHGDHAHGHFVQERHVPAHNKQHSMRGHENRHPRPPPSSSI